MSEEPKHIGPYRILLTMGTGGMGVVYAAERESDGVRVAIKTLNVPHAWMLGGIRREIRALARIRHPGIVRIVDEGVDGGVPWFAMEIVMGKPLDEAAEELPSESADASDGRPPAGGGSLLGRLTLVRRLCSALAYLHGEGIVHRDLKPANILVRPEGMPVIIDFGLMSRFAAATGRESMEEVGRTAGTFAYMAPEQARGDLVDPRADLYALGCILYELVTGSAPFGTAKATDVLIAHLTTDPTPASDLVSGVPPKLDALILKLLAKSPRERMGHAEDVAAALAGLGAGNGLAASGLRPRPYLYRPGLHGRDATMEMLAGAASRLASGHGGILMLQGEAGMGKTRLLLSLATELRERRVDALTGACEPPTAHGGASRPLGAFMPVLQSIVDRCRQQGRDAVDRVFGVRGPILAEVMPGIASLPGMEADPPEPLPPDAARLRLFGYLMETLGEVGREGPLALLFDDVQWADELSASFLSYFARHRKLFDCRVLIVAGCRPEEAPPVLKDLMGADVMPVVTLQAFAAASVRDMVADMLGVAAPPRGLLEFLAQRTEGNPFLVTEYVRLAVQRGLLYRESAGHWSLAGGEADGTRTYENLPLPEAVRDMLGPRLQAVSPAANQFLEAASVLGLPARDEHLTVVSGLDERAMDDAALSLIALGVLEEDAASRLRFVKERVRLLAYERMDSSRRRELHRKAAECLLHDEERLGELAHHWEKAGEPARAAPIFLAAARHATRRFLHQEAERFYRSFLALQTTNESTVAARRELAEEVLRPIGDSATAQAELEQALREARRFGLRGFEAACLEGLARGERISGRILDAKTHLSEALEILKAEGDRRGEGQCLFELGALAYDLGRLDEARGLFEASLAVAAQVARPEDEAAALGRLANIHADQGRIRESRTLYRKALDLSRRLGQRAAEAGNLENLASLYQLEGATEKALDHHEAALALAKMVGARRLQGQILANLGALHETRGRLEDARALYDAALRIAREIGERRAEGSRLTSLAGLACLQGRLSDSVRLLKEALDLHREVGHRQGMGIALAHLGICRQLQGKRAEARKSYERAISVEQQVEDKATRALVLARLAEIEIEEGRPREAAALVRDALKAVGEAPAPAIEAFALLVRARILRLSADGSGADSSLGEAQSLIEDLGHKQLLGLYHCQRAHLALVTDADAGTHLEAARDLATQMGAGAKSELGLALVRLERSLDAHRRGVELFCGELGEDLGHG